jgi:protein-S-isoprenylcysteine O-methyltransferase Ste14
MTLELKVPPPLVALILGAAMWALSEVIPVLGTRGLLTHVAAGAIALAGGAFSLAGILSFRRAQTTVNPLKPENASSLVTGGVYRFTRNPMYVGLLFVLVAWAVFLVNPWTLLGPVLFVAYMNRFQIKPEERALVTLFGEQYAAYAAKVRRWL